MIRSTVFCAAINRSIQLARLSVYSCWSSAVSVVQRLSAPKKNKKQRWYLCRFFCCNLFCYEECITGASPGGWRDYLLKRALRALRLACSAADKGADSRRAFFPGPLLLLFPPLCRLLERHSAAL